MELPAPESTNEWRDLLVQSIRSGRVVSSGREVDAQSPTTRDALPAAAIRAAVLSKDLEPDPLGLRIIGLRIIGELDLDDADVPCTLGLFGCHFEASPSFSAARLQALWLTRSHLPGISLDQAKVSRGLYLNDLNVEGSMSMIGASVDGALALKNSKVSNAEHAALVMDKVRASNGVFASNIEVRGEVRLLAADIDGQFDMSSSVLRNTDGDALSLDQARIAGSAFLSEMKVDGKVRAVGTEVGGQLTLSESTFSCPQREALSLDRCILKGSVFGTRLNTVGEVRALGARIGGQLVLDDAILTNPGDDALSLDRIHIGDELVLRGATVTGRVRVQGAEIGGRVNLINVEIKSDEGTALGLDRARLNNGLRATSAKIAGGIQALGAQFDGQVSMRQAVVSNESGYSFILDGARFAGDFYADACNISGEFSASGVEVFGQLGLTNTSVTASRSGSALTLDNARLDGGLFGEGLKLVGQLRLPRSTIGSILDLDKASVEFDSPDRPGLLLDNARLDGNFTAQDARLVGGVKGWGLQTTGRMVLRTTTAIGAPTAIDLQASHLAHLYLGAAGIEGAIVLSSADIAVLRTTRDAPRSLYAAGWRIGDLHGPLRSDWKLARRWLDSTPSKQFTSQPWHEMANFYDRIGQPVDARHMRFEAAIRVTRETRYPARALRDIYGLLVGFGYYPLLALAWIAVVAGIALGATLLLGPSGFVATSSAARLPSTSLPAGVVCPMTAEPITAATDPKCYQADYPRFNPVLFVIGTTTPAGSLSSPAWAPRSGWWDLGFSMTKLAGWILTALLLAGVTGLLRKT
jgi:hypothetical protein